LYCVVQYVTQLQVSALFKAILRLYTLSLVSNVPCHQGTLLTVETQQNLLYCVVQYVTQLHVSALFLGNLQVVYA